MESLRHQVLQAELKRIEEEAEAKSYAIMNKADQLTAAYALCARINEGLEPHQRFHPSVMYCLDTTCRVFIYTTICSAIFMRRCAELGIQIEPTGEKPAHNDPQYATVAGVPGVTVSLRDYFFADAV